MINKGLNMLREDEEAMKSNVLRLLIIRALNFKTILSLREGCEVADYLHATINGKFELKLKQENEDIRDKEI